MGRRGVRALVCVAGLVFAALLCPALRAEEEPADERAAPGWWLEKARTFAERIHVPDGRAALLVSIGTYAVEAGRLEDARSLLGDAAAYGMRCRGCFAKAQRLADVALLLHRAGDVMAAGRTFNAARAACDEFGAGPDRVAALAYLAERRAAAGEGMVARILLVEAQTAALALEGVERVEALAGLVPVLGALGEDGRARVAVTMLRGQAHRHGSGDVRPIVSPALLAFVEILLGRGRFVEARHFAGQITDPSSEVTAWCTIVRAERRVGAPLSARGHIPWALAAAARVEDGAARARSLLEVAETAAFIGADEEEVAAVVEAEREVFAEPDASAQVTGLVALARRHASAGREVSARKILEAAGTAARTAPEAAQPGLWRQIAAAQARRGAFVDAERAALEIEDPAVRAEARLDVAEAHRAAGNLAMALAIAANLPRGMARWGEGRPLERDLVLRRMAVLQARCGRLDLAAATVDEIATPFQAATACTYVARDRIP